MSLGKDLATIRNELGLTLEEIQGQIKIPAHIIQTIENDSIFDELETNKTYTRSFVRSYARILKVSDENVVDALDSLEAGLYVPGSLLEKEGQQKLAPIINPEVLDEPEEEKTASNNLPEIEHKPQQPAPTVENVNWADLGKKFAEPTTRTKIFIPVIIALVIVAISIVVFIYKDSIFGSSESDSADQIEETNGTIGDLVDQPADTSTVVTNPIESEESSEESTTPEIVESVQVTSLSDTLSVIVYAAFDKLEPVRVTSDFNWRTNPFWLEQGEAYSFSFLDTMLVRGQYSRMLLLFNGHVIENPDLLYYNEAFDSIMLTRGDLDNESYFSVPPSEFPYSIGAPDSLVFPLQN